MTARPLDAAAIGIVASLLVGDAGADPPAAAASQLAPAAPPPAPTASDAPARVPPFVQPATGTPVEFDSDRPHVSVFVAPGIISNTRPSYPDPFVKIGRTPLATKLAPGTYTVTAESPDITNGSAVVQVGTQPVHVRVRAGSSDMRTMGSLVLGVGIASVLAAIAVEVSYSQTPTGISKSKIAVPLFIVGGVGVGAGLALFFASGTTIEPDGPKPDRAGAFVGVMSRW
jgi:hypothetical protein